MRISGSAAKRQTRREAEGAKPKGLLKEVAGLSNRELRKEMPGHLVK
jgi:hypothetical protein